MSGLSPGPQCCCGNTCPDKNVYSVPDSITIGYSLLDSSGDGIPVNTIIGNCGGSPIFRKWKANALLAALGSIPYNYVEKLGCCYHYHSSTDITPDCPIGNTTAYKRFGTNPFSGAAIGALVDITTCSGNAIALPPVTVDDGTNCCPRPTDMDCTGLCGTTIQWYSGVAASPKATYGFSDLLLCVRPTTVNLSITVKLFVPCQMVTTGRVAGSGPPCTSLTGTSQTPGATPPHCGGTDFLDCTDGTIGCNIVEVNFGMNASGNPSLGTGTTVWDKVKSLTFTSPFEYATCSCAPTGCVDHLITGDFSCAVDYNCNPIGGDLLSSTETFGAPIHQECIYAVGHLGMSLTG